MTTLLPDTPPHVLSDWTEERCHELGLPCSRDDNGLTITIPAREDGLPDWERFLQVAKQLRHAEAWVMDGAEPLTYGWLFQLDDMGYPLYGGEWSANTAPRFLMRSGNIELFGYRRNGNKKQFLDDLSRACVAYSRSGETTDYANSKEQQ